MASGDEAGALLHAVLLAAGESTRFGSPKQLARVDGRPLLARAIEAAIAVVGRRAVTVVLGAHAAQLEPLAVEAGVSFVVNPEFAEGIASSIRRGVAETPRGARGVLILLADQAAVTVDDLRRLVDEWRRAPARIVAASHSGIVGVPAIFPVDVAPELAVLRGDRGARSVIAAHPGRVTAVPMPSAAFDVDTPADLLAVQKR